MCLFVSADVFTEAGKLEGLLAFKVGKTQRASPKKKQKRKKKRKKADVCTERQKKLSGKKVFWTRAKSAWSSLTPKTITRTHTKLQHGGHKLTHTYT